MLHVVHHVDYAAPAPERGTFRFDKYHLVMTALRESGYDGWLLVELDSYAGNPRDAAALSKTFLDNLLAASGAAASPHHGETR